MGKLSTIEQYRALSSAINRTSQDMTWPRFVKRFEIWIEGDQKLILEIDKEEKCRFVDQKVLEYEAAYYLEKFTQLYEMPPKKLKEAVGYWLMKTPALIEKPKDFRWQDEYGLAFSVIPFDRVSDVMEKPEEHFPTWNSILQRMNNSDAFIEFIACILNGKKLQSYLWINGQGADGKGSMSRCLARAFGQAYCATNVPDESQKRFWARQLLGKTIIVFNDCNEASFVKTSIFKQLSGGDAITIDPKGKDMFQAVMHPYFIFFSNFDPRISSSRADLRRLVHCTLEAVSKAQWHSDFETKLWAEMGAFLRFCDQHYNNNIERLTNDPFISTEEAEDLASENEDKFDGYMHSAFEFAEDSKIEQGRFYSICKFQLRLNDFEIGEFKRWLKTKHNLKTVRSASDRQRRWVGLRAIPVHSKQATD